MDRRLLRTFLEIYPFQPATAVWRASEVAALARADFPSGLGLDLGCGDGRLTRVLSDRVGGLRLVGLDIDPLETALAQGERFYERVHTTTGENIPEPDASFDFVVSVSVIEHIPNLPGVLRDVARVLKRGAPLLTTVPSVGFHDCLRGPLMPGSSRDEYLRALDRRVAHLHYWSIADWQRRAGRRRHAAGRSDADPRTRRDAPVGDDLARDRRSAAGRIGRQATARHPAIDGHAQAGATAPGPLAGMLAQTLALGLDDTAPSHERESGCLLVIAERR